jgi:hypothetical protein
LSAVNINLVFSAKEQVLVLFNILRRENFYLCTMRFDASALTFRRCRTYFFAIVPIIFTPFPKEPNMNKFGNDPENNLLLFPNLFIDFSDHSTWITLGNIVLPELFNDLLFNCTESLPLFSSNGLWLYLYSILLMRSVYEFRH